jgi:electron transport complex protein RnfC
MRPKTFSRGGVHPPENKLSSGAKIIELPPPEMVVIPLSQHLGAPPKPLVEKGSEVIVGQVIKADGFISTNIHSSVSGKVLKVDQFPDISGYRRMAVQIQVVGDTWLEDIDRSDDIVPHTVLSPEDIRKKILEAGIVQVPCQTSSSVS